MEPNNHDKEVAAYIATTAAFVILKGSILLRQSTSPEQAGDLTFLMGNALSMCHACNSEGVIYNGLARLFTLDSELRKNEAREMERIFLESLETMSEEITAELPLLDEKLRDMFAFMQNMGKSVMVDKVEDFVHPAFPDDFHKLFLN